LKTIRRRPVFKNKNETKNKRRKQNVNEKTIDKIFERDESKNKNESKTKIQKAYEENKVPRTGKINSRDVPKELIEQRVATKKRTEEKRLMKKYNLTAEEAKRLRRKNQNEKSTTLCGKNAEAIIKNRKRNEAAKKRGPRHRLEKERIKNGEEVIFSEKDPTRLKRKDMKHPYPAKDQKCVVDKKKVLDKLGWGMTTYENSYPQIAYDILSSAPFKTKSHLCRAFFCSKPTLMTWMRKHKLFLEAVECGLAAGEAMFRDKAQLKAWMPNKEVNNGLIQMLARNVYGISKESDIEINIGVGKEGSIKTAEEEMAERGIPLPGLMVADMDATIQTPPYTPETAQEGDSNNDRTGTDTPGQSDASLPQSFPIADMDDTGTPNSTDGTLPQGDHGLGKQGEDVRWDGGDVEPGEEPQTPKSGDSKRLAGAQPTSPLAGMDGITEPGSPVDPKKALKVKETALIHQNMENQKLRTQVRALELANANRIKEQASRVVAGFGSDFSTSDSDVQSPFGITGKHRKNIDPC